MKLKTILPLLSSAMVIWNVGTARADNDWPSRVDFHPNAAIFSGNELSLDLFGYTATRDKGGADHEAWGAGAAGNYYFTKNFGVGAETYADAFTHPYLINGLGEFRYPLQNISLAPYGFVGFGRQWTHAAQWLGFVGGGAEYRFNENTGFFVDARLVIPGNTANNALIRFGFRFVF